MFSSPTPAPGSRTIAGSALRKAGLMDRDAHMRDLTDEPGGRKSHSKLKLRKRLAPGTKEELIGGSRSSSSRASTSTSALADAITIRGAARTPAQNRFRRTVVSGAPGPVPRVKPRGVAAWKELVQKRWDPQTQCLNLESLIDDELVKKYNLTPPGRGGDAREAAVIFKLARSMTPPVKTLSLANNNLSGQHLQFLSRYLPHLQNLSLQNNNIRSFKELDYISARKDKLVRLRELILIGNPVRDHEFQKDNGAHYRQLMAQQFSTLEILDHEAIAQISFDVPAPTGQADAEKKPTAKTFPFEMGGSFVAGVGDPSLISNFLSRFFSALDNAREALGNAYHPTATFSYSVNTSIPPRARVLGFQTKMPNQQKLNWGPWLADQGSRNLMRVNGGLDRTLKSFHTGPQDIVKTLAGLPGTKHDIAGPPEMFSIDAFPIMAGDTLLLTIHGQFTEVGTEGIRSFDRSFVLIAAPEGSSAKLNGWDLMILSDQWTVRSYSSHESWKPGMLHVQAPTRAQQQAQNIAAVQASASQPPQTQQPAQVQAAQPPMNPLLANMPEPQRNLVIQLSQRTGLNAQYSIDCLANNEWNMERAIAVFEQVKGTLPREAFT